MAAMSVASLCEMSRAVSDDGARHFASDRQPPSPTYTRPPPSALRTIIRRERPKANTQPQQNPAIAQYDNPPANSARLVPRHFEGVDRAVLKQRVSYRNGPVVAQCVPSKEQGLQTPQGDRILPTWAATRASASLLCDGCDVVYLLYTKRRQWLPMRKTGQGEVQGEFGERAGLPEDHT